MTRHRYRRNVATTTAKWTSPDDELCSVECEVSGGEKEIRYGDNACPASPPEFEILRVIGEDGKERPDLMDAAKADRDRIEDAVFEALADDDGGRADDEYDRRREMAREER